MHLIYDSGARESSVDPLPCFTLQWLQLETDIRRLRDSADPWKNILDGKPVHFDGLATGGVLGENNGVAMFPGLSGG